MKINLPADVLGIIHDFAAQMEHTDKWHKVCYELQATYWIRKRVRLNFEFRGLFYPGFYSDLFTAHLNLNLLL